MCTTTLFIGWFRDYRSVGAYLAFWALSTLTAVAAWNIVRAAYGSAPTLDGLLRAFLVAFALIVVSGLTLGAIGRLTLTGYATTQLAIAAASLLARPAAAARTPPAERGVPVWTIGVGGALLAFAAAFAASHAPLTLYDSLSYHLFFPARWLQDHALSIIPTPFSDEAQAYAPGNGELFFLWLMLPFHGDLLARAGQLPFALGAALALYLLARRLGAAPAHAIYPPLFLLLSRPILEQTVGANVDLICAAMFLTSLYLGLAAVDRNRVSDWLLCGVGLGLFFGTKYVALVYAPVFLLLAAAGGPRLNMLWTLPGIAALALPWYARNWVVAGSPIYPASLSVAGATLARGAFGRDAMLNTVFHTTDARLLPAIVAHAFGPTLFLVWIPAAVVGGFLLVRRGWWPHAVVVLLPYVMLPLFWFGLPVNIDSRFLMPAIAPALLPFAFTFQLPRTSSSGESGEPEGWTGRTGWNAPIHAAYAVAAIWILVGARREIAASLPWFMAGWLALDGLLGPRFVVVFAVLALAIAAAWQMMRTSPRRMRWAPAVVACILAGATTAMAVGADRWCAPASCDYLDVTSPRIRPNLLAAWQWVDAHVENATVAYTGINLPYPLAGEHLANRVVYVNIDGRPKWRFHDYDRAYRAGRFDPIPPALATSSGELLPLASRAGPRDDALRPRYERMQGIRDAWIDNLRQMHVRYVFVSALSAYDVDYVWHNAEGFPIEDAWASAAPRRFPRVYENSQVRIYEVVPDEAAP